MSKLDEMKATFWNTVDQRPHIEIEGALVEILRKHIEHMIAEARAHGRTGEDIYNPDDPPVVSPADDAYAKLVISALTPSPEEGP